jgi:hypothetical protein
MKCLKNRKTSNIVRVSDQQAQQMVGTQWEYVSKSEWKQVTRKIVKVAEPIKGGDAIAKTIEEKRLKHKKQKSK